MAKIDELKSLLKDQLRLAQAAKDVLQESHDRAAVIFKQQSDTLTPEQRETLEALTARFSRLCDFLTQRLFRTIDDVELTSEGSLIDRFNRFEKRGILKSADQWRELRDLRNEIAHEYLIEKSDRVVKDAFQKSSVLFETLIRTQEYCRDKFKIQ